MAQPPGSDTLARPQRASSGPSTSTEARMVFTSSYGAVGSLIPAARSVNRPSAGRSTSTPIWRRSLPIVDVHEARHIGESHALLGQQRVALTNVPRLVDISTMGRLLRQMGVEVERPADGRLMLRAAGISDPTAPYELVKTMRASVLVLGPLLARCGRARVSLPG